MAKGRKAAGSQVPALRAKASSPPPPPWVSSGRADRHPPYPAFPKAPQPSKQPQGGGPIPAYPILTEEVGYPPSPVANIGSTSGREGSAGRGTLGPVVARALQDVLGWKVSGGDPKGFLGALTQSFTLNAVEGRVEAAWKPRSYAVSSDLAGGISGAQASLYAMARTLLDQSLPLVDGLYALDPAADPEYVAALKQLANSQLTELVNELAYLGGPRVVRVHQYFQMLLGISIAIEAGPPPSIKFVKPTPQQLQIEPPGPPLPAGEPPTSMASSYWTQPDGVLGTLGNLRDELGLAEPTTLDDTEPSYINTVADEQNVTNFRILVDYVNSLLNSWQNSFQFFFVNTATPFLGTQLVLISRQLGVISETVDEVRFVLDSVFLGPAERQTYVLQLLDPTNNNQPLPTIFLEDLLSWVQNYVTGEAPGLIQNGGRLALGQDFANMVWQFTVQIYATYQFAQQQAGSPINTDRVLFSLSKLSSQLYELYTSAYQVGVPYLAPRP
jgi:hypothetical protein